MKNTTYIIKEKEDWENLALYVHKQFSEKRIFLLKGNLGAGKTTFVQAFGKLVDVVEHITSPTFGIMNEYHFADQLMYHLDLYRIKDLRELKDIGIEDILYSKNYCFVEWPELIVEIIKQDKTLVEKTLVADIHFDMDKQIREVVMSEIEV
jgi:tRNA threonylcarbamoyladenosine biosynthesis protein TsaE